jgi:hypothetical protein
MKALKSQFAESLLRDPASAQQLRVTQLKPGFGAASAVQFVLAPVDAQGVRQPPMRVTMMRVHKADYYQPKGRGR